MKKMWDDQRPLPLPHHPRILQDGRPVKSASDMSWHAALLSLLLLSQGVAGSGHKSYVGKNQQKKVEPKVFSFELRPTATLALNRRRRLSTNASSATEAPFYNETYHWHHPNSNAIYATIPKREEMSEFEYDEHLEDFHRYRHLSRYERHLRLQNGWDLQPDWDGIYDFDGLEDLQNTTTNAINDTLEGSRLLKDSSSTHFGGIFNNYQGVSLSQGYGTHYVNAWVGSPTPQRKTLIVDTGSHYTAFPCTGCKNCGLKHHTDPYFNPEKSDTFHVLDCGECREGVSCKDERCVFSQSYTEGSSWEAYQVSDNFYCGGNDMLGAVDPKDQKYTIDFMFGCQLSLNGLFKTQLADGIAGFSMFETTLVKQMYNKGKIEHNIFALCYRRELGSSKRGVSAGSMTLGGVSNSLDTSPMIFAKNMASVGFYTVYVKNIFLRAGGGQSAMTPPDGDYRIHKVSLNIHKINSGKGVIVDSGTTDTYLNKHAGRSFNKMWKKVTGKDYAHSPISLNDEQLRSLPTILVQCQAYDMRIDPSIQNPENIVGYAGTLDPSSPNDLLIAIPATNYMEYSPRTKLYASRVYFTETSGGVLGSNTMQGHNVVFDWERIGFAESSCTYDRKEAPKESEEGRFSSDCTVATPVLTQMCVETVEEDICDNNPPNVALLGMETWTVVVENPGTGAGLSCIEAMRKLSPSTEDDPSTITCDGAGLCTELRPCQITCTELPKAKEVGYADNAMKRQPVDLECGDTFWGACDYKCNQTRIFSSLFTDGNCHEVERKSRTCHIDACGRSDPCRVPFVVHAIFVFPGVEASKWSKRDEDIFTESLAQAYRALSPTAQSLFGVGDIKVVLVRPWVAEDDVETFPSGDDENEELGVKVVAQISIFNPHVESASFGEATEKQTEVDDSTETGSPVKNNTGGSAPAVCKDSDLFALAKQARLIAYAIPEYPNFIPQLVGNILSEESVSDLDDKSAFSPLFEEPYLAQQSRLLSSWTIRTAVDDEINYFGPPEPLFFTILRYVHRIALVTFCFSLFVFMWGVAVQSMDFMVAAYNTARTWLPWYRDSGPAYHPVATDQDGSEVINNIEEKNSSAGNIFQKSSIRRRFSIGRENGDNSVELTILKSGVVSNDLRNSSSTHKKRRNSGAEGTEESHNKSWQLSHQMSV